MLIESIRYMHDDKASYGKIFGQEKNLATSAIARMNLFLHGAQDFNVTQGDTLRSPNYLYRGELRTFDCVIANPPFSLSKWGAEQFSTDIYGRNMWGCPSDSNADFAWLQHMVRSMDRKNGRCTVVLPQGVLFRGGKEGEIRRELVKSGKLDAVITLVGGLFYGAGVSACILVLRNDGNMPASHKGKVALIDASEIYTPMRAQNVMTEENVDEAFKLYDDYVDVPEKVKIVTLEEIEAKGYTLSVNNYIEKKRVEMKSYSEVLAEFYEALTEMEKCEKKLKELLIKGGYINE